MKAIDFELLNISSELPANVAPVAARQVSEKPLPTGTDPYSKSVVSVYCRGFHNFAPPMILFTDIEAEILRKCAADEERGVLHGAA